MSSACSLRGVPVFRSIAKRSGGRPPGNHAQVELLPAADVHLDRLMEERARGGVLRVLEGRALAKQRGVEAALAALEVNQGALRQPQGIGCALPSERRELALQPG